VYESGVAIGKKLDRLALKLSKAKEESGSVPLITPEHVQSRPSAPSLAITCGELLLLLQSCCLRCASNVLCVLAAAASTLIYHCKNSTTLADMASADRPRTFLDIDINGEPAGRLVFELFTEKTPKTCEKYGINRRAIRQNRDADWSHVVFGNCARRNTMAFLMLHHLFTASSRNS
jgi:hypothetical protein